MHRDHLLRGIIIQWQITWEIISLCFMCVINDEEQTRRTLWNAGREGNRYRSLPQTKLRFFNPTPSITRQSIFQNRMLSLPFNRDLITSSRKLKCNPCSCLLTLEEVDDQHYQMLEGFLNEVIWRNEISCIQLFIIQEELQENCWYLHRLQLTA